MVYLGLGPFFLEDVKIVGTYVKKKLNDSFWEPLKIWITKIYDNIFHLNFSITISNESEMDS